MTAEWQPLSTLPWDGDSLPRGIELRRAQTGQWDRAIVLIGDDVMECPAEESALKWRYCMANFDAWRWYAPPVRWQTGEPQRDGMYLATVKSEPNYVTELEWCGEQGYGWRGINNKNVLAYAEMPDPWRG